MTAREEFNLEKEAQQVACNVYHNTIEDARIIAAFVRRCMDEAYENAVKILSWKNYDDGDLDVLECLGKKIRALKSSPKVEP